MDDMEAMLREVCGVAAAVAVECVLRASPSLWCITPRRHLSSGVARDLSDDTGRPVWRALSAARGRSGGAAHRCAYRCPARSQLRCCAW
jgi:hypothetical protein